jgi:hypothetical protein
MTDIKHDAPAAESATIPEWERYRNQAEAAQQNLTEANDRVRTLTVQNAALSNDLRLIASALREEASSRQWCDEYGTFIDRLNTHTSQVWLQHCNETYTWTFIVRVDATVPPGQAETIREEIRGAIQNTITDIDFDGTLEDYGVELRR